MSESRHNERIVFSQKVWLLPHQQVEEELGTSTLDGLTESEALARLEIYGKNALQVGSGGSVLDLLVQQIANAMCLVLIGAMVVSFAVQDWIAGGVIAAVVFVNVVVGFWQNYQAENTMSRLKSLGSPSARVIRDGTEKTVMANKVVPGDVVELKAGDTVPADLRLFEASNLEVDEALLTGESLPIPKITDALEEAEDEHPVGDRVNLAFSSSTVTKGRAKGVVVATGMNTEVGAIAAAMKDEPKHVRKVKRNETGSASPVQYLIAGAAITRNFAGHLLGVNVGTPLHRKLAKFALLLLGCACITAIIVFAVNDFRGGKEVVIYAVTAAIALIPASLLAVLTITMAAGAKSMVTRNVIVRKLASLEALGAVTDICSDKTGTLTQGKMVTRKAWVIGHGTYTVADTEDPSNPTVGTVSFRQKQPIEEAAGDNDGLVDSWTSVPILQSHPLLANYLDIASLCNLAVCRHVPDDGGKWKTLGDPTEIAIQVFAYRFGYDRSKLLAEGGGNWKMLAEYPFDSDIKRMTIVFDDTVRQQRWAFMKGAVERILPCCSMIGGQQFTQDLEAEVIRNVQSISSQGLRCLALASRCYDYSEIWKTRDRADAEQKMDLVGLIGLYDPPRHESSYAVKHAHEAGINVHMLTGDHQSTARAIAIQVGILPSGVDSMDVQNQNALVMTATQFDSLPEQEIDALPVLPLVIARCAPHTKVRMIEALHRRNKFCAMTGDGVNDSPSLKRADIGIAMGMAGSDVAKEASDIVLADDNFASIMNAIEEGRRMFDNIQKFVLHLLTINVAQAIYLLAGLAFEDQAGRSVFPLSPAEILWLVMIAQSFPAMGLGFEPAHRDVLRRPPHSLKQGLFTREVIIDCLAYGLAIAAQCVTSYVIIVFGFNDGDLGRNCNSDYNDSCTIIFRARSATFAIITFVALILPWEIIDLRESIFTLDPTRPPVRQLFHNLYRNHFLFWSIVCGGLTVPAVIYIPWVDHVVFMHTGITWEWAVVVVNVLVFIVFVEMYKFAKRVHYRESLGKEPGDIEMGQPTSDGHKSS